MTRSLILKMQEAVTDYLIPETYVRRRPGGTCPHDSEVAMPAHNHSKWAVSAINRKRDEMFISDIIYFLDSEEHGTNVRKTDFDICGYCKGGTDENVTHCPVCEGKTLKQIKEPQMTIRTAIAIALYAMLWAYCLLWALA